jgi:hypothetical protein
MTHNSFSAEADVLRRILRISPLLIIAFLAACSAGDDLTGPAVPQHALAGVSSTHTPVLNQNREPGSTNQLATKGRRKRGVRYAMGAN